MAAGNDFCGNPLWNLHLHPTATDVDRGLPGVGKLVTRTDQPGELEICVDTDPDPDEDGGGTWQRVGGMGPWQSFSPTGEAILGSITDPTNTASATRYITDGTTCMLQTFINFAVGATPGSGEYRVVLPFDVVGTTGWPLGQGWINDASTDDWYPVIAVGTDPAAYCTLLMPITGLGLVEATSPFTWDVGDELVLSLTYRIA